MRTRTSQEKFWTGIFGDDYTDRNVIEPSDRSGFFASVLAKTEGVKTICELGANRGHNLEALKLTGGDYDLTGVEINEQAFAILEKLTNVQAVLSSIQDFDPPERFDLVMIVGVLIHINPDDLPEIYAKMARLSKRYVLICEYYNPVPVEVPYREHKGVLFKRDFAGEFLDKNDGQFRVVDVGFLWGRTMPSWDNQTWFLLERI